MLVVGDRLLRGGLARCLRQRWLDSPLTGGLTLSGMESPVLRGSCACSKVHYEVDAAVSEAHHCHCSTCRKAHGAAFATYARVPAKALRIVSGKEELVAYRSSAPVQRTFCRSCGSSLFFDHDAIARVFRWVAAGTLDGGDVTPDAHTFLASKAAWCVLNDDLAKHDGQRPEYA